jgi:hypothetical protein
VYALLSKRAIDVILLFPASAHFGFAGLKRLSRRGLTFRRNLVTARARQYPTIPSVARRRDRQNYVRGTLHASPSSFAWQAQTSRRRWRSDQRRAMSQWIR